MPSGRRVDCAAVLIVLELDDGSHERVGSRRPALAIGIGEYQPFAVDNFKINSLILYLFAVDIHYRVEFAADPQVNLAGVEAVGGGHEEVLDMLRRCPALPKHRARCIEGACKTEIGFRIKFHLCVLS